MKCKLGKIMMAIFFLNARVFFKTHLYLLLNAFDALPVVRAWGEVREPASLSILVGKKSSKRSYATVKRIGCRNVCSLQGQSRKITIFSLACLSCASAAYQVKRKVKAAGKAASRTRCFQYSLQPRGTNTASPSATTHCSNQEDDAPRKANTVCRY